MRHGVPLLVGILILSSQSASQQGSAPSGVLRVIVTQAGTAEPVRRARITLRRVGSGALPAASPEGGRNAGAIQTVTADESGRFVLDGVAPGQYRISAEREGYVRQEFGQRSLTGPGVLVDLQAGQRLDIPIALPRTGVVTGRVLDEFGEPMTGVQVQAISMIYREGVRTPNVVQQATTNDLGEYRLFFLTPGDYVVAYTVRGGRRGPGTSPPAGPPDVASEDEAYATVYFPGTLDLTSAVPVNIPSGMEQRGIDVRLNPVRTLIVRGRVSSPLAATGAPQTPQRAPQGTARGPVRQGLAAGRIQLFVQPVDGPSRGRGFGGMRPAQVGADGAFAIRGVLPGSYWLTAIQWDGQSVFAARTRVDVGRADVDNVSLALRPGTDVAGRVIVDSTQAPRGFSLNQVNVRLRPDVEWPSDPAGAQPAADGSFALRNVPVFRQRLTVGGLGGGFVASAQYGTVDATTGFDVDPASQAPLVIRISFSTGSVSGDVVNNRDQAYPAVQVVLVPAEGLRHRTEMYRTAMTDQYGRFSLTNVPAGTYKLFAWEEVPQGAYMDPEFIVRYEGRGKSVVIDANGQFQARLQVIPAGVP